MTRFVVCGETLIDLVKDDGPSDDHFSSTWHALSAGGPMNSAVALGRLGADSHFLGRLSSDDFGRQLRRHIEAADVQLDLATTVDQSTSIAVVTLDEEGVASYAFHFTDTANFTWQTADLPPLKSDDWLHIASLACVVRPGSDVLLEWARTVDCPISYDINVRPTVIIDPAEYWARVEPWLAAVARTNGVVKASDVDLEFLAQAINPGISPEDLATAWVDAYGLRFAVITRGEGGAVAVLPGGEQVAVPGYPTEVVDTVGAGDTFMAGFLDAHVRDPADLPAALRRGAAAASIVCSRQGAQPPTATEVDALVASGA